PTDWKPVRQRLLQSLSRNTTTAPRRSPLLRLLYSATARWSPAHCDNDTREPCCVTMRAIGYARVSTDRQADHGVSLEAQEAKIRAMAMVQGAELIDLIVDGGESGKNLKRPGMERVLSLVEGRQIEAVIVAKLDRLTRSVKDLCALLELFEKRGVALVSVADSLDTNSAAGRLVITIMAAVSQWVREAIGERTR